MKSRTAGFVPYRVIDGRINLYLQKRTADAPHNAGNYGIFGGMIKEGETTKEALVREVKEELNFDVNPRECTLLGEFEEEISIVSLFYMHAENDFESKVDVLEGDYGTFVPEGNILDNEYIARTHQGIFMNLIRYLKQN